MPVIRAKPVVHIEDVIIVFVVVPIVVYRLARLREHPTWVGGGLVLELRIADMVRLHDIRRQLLERL